MIELPYLWPVLSVVQTAFTIWMLVDAYRRQAEAYWFWVILLFQPLGAWIYFFVIKGADLRGLTGLLQFQRRPSLAELRYRADHLPTLSSNLDLAERLIEMDQHQDALLYLEAARKREPDHCRILYLLAVCSTELGELDSAVEFLNRINGRDRCWSDYSAWRLLVDVHDQRSDGAAALSACRELVRLSPTLRHKCLLADHLFDEGLVDEASNLLRQALEDYRYSPSNFRWRNRRWASEARRLCKQLTAVKCQVSRMNQRVPDQGDPE